MTAIATMAMVNIDCADPRAMAEFYGQVFGAEVLHSADDYAMIASAGAPIGFGRVDGYQPPPWPDPTAAKQFHLDLYVDDLDRAQAECEKLGASVPEFQPGDTWRVLLDPAGHPFCLCRRPSDG